ncbi:MAG: fumarylacetoacetate hydrolase family protein [Actinobacteria bacterium]|nr:fumarylacetoacetate hydrolase family protein [Actinomycetota bacterium]
MNFEPDVKFDINNYFPGKIVCVGMNYKSHISEQDGRFPSRPVLFAKATSSIIKDGENIFYPPEVKELDYEVELAVIIGNRMKNICEKDVLSHIYGYTIINDLTAREIQKNEGQWFRAKSFDTFAPIGPVIIPRNKIQDPQNLFLKSYVNGKLRQNSNTSDMIFKVFELISYISKSMTLEAGDLISTGTPAGVGAFMKEKKFLLPGDEVICEIEKIGRLVNKVVSL